MAAKVLVVDDERIIVKGLRYSLQQEGYEVECAYDGEEAVNAIREKHFDIVLLDVMLPKLSGFEVLQQVREFSDVPIIMLTAKGDDMDKILGLDYGADDYVTKPFNPLEVKGRIKAIIRRTSRSRQAEVLNENIIEVGDLRMDMDNRRVTLADKEINLTSKEFELLELLYPPSPRKNRAQCLRAEICTDQVGRRILFPQPREVRSSVFSLPV